MGRRRVEDSAEIRRVERAGALLLTRLRVLAWNGAAGAFEQRPDTDLLLLYRRQAILQSMPTGEQAILRALVTDDLKTGEGDAGGEDGR